MAIDPMTAMLLSQAAGEIQGMGKEIIMHPKKQEMERNARDLSARAHWVGQGDRFAPPEANNFWGDLLFAKQTGGQEGIANQQQYAHMLAGLQNMDFGMPQRSPISQGVPYSGHPYEGPNIAPGDKFAQTSPVSMELAKMGWA